MYKISHLINPVYIYMYIYQIILVYPMYPVHPCTRYHSSLSCKFLTSLTIRASFFRVKVRPWIQIGITQSIFVQFTWNKNWEYLHSMERKLTHITSPNRRYLTVKTCIKVVTPHFPEHWMWRMISLHITKISHLLLLPINKTEN